MQTRGIVRDYAGEHSLKIYGDVVAYCAECGLFAVSWPHTVRITDQIFHTKCTPDHEYYTGARLSTQHRAADAMAYALANAEPGKEKETALQDLLWRISAGKAGRAVRTCTFDAFERDFEFIKVRDEVLEIERREGEAAKASGKKYTRKKNRLRSELILRGFFATALMSVLVDTCAYTNDDHDKGTAALRRLPQDGGLWPRLFLRGGRAAKPPTMQDFAERCQTMPKKTTLC